LVLAGLIFSNPSATSAVSSKKSNFPRKILSPSGLVHHERLEFAKIKAIKSEPTPREHEIINTLVDGLSYKLIADKMSISINTVRFHIRNIYRKLQVHSKAEVIRNSLKGEI